MLHQAGLNLAEVVRLTTYTTDVDAFVAGFEVVATRLAQAEAQVSSTLLGVSRLAAPALLVELEATAVA